MQQTITITATVLNSAIRISNIASFTYEQTLDAPTYSMVISCSIDDSKIIEHLRPNQTKRIHIKVTIQQKHFPKEQTYFGTITHLEHTQNPREDAHNTVISLAWEGQRLWQNRRTGIYYGPTLKDVIQQGFINTIQRNHLNRYTHFKTQAQWQNTNRYPWHPSLAQYLESDGAFIDRQCRRHGLWRYFEHTADGTRLLLGDANHHFSTTAPIQAYPDELQHSDKPGLFSLFPNTRFEGFNTRYYGHITLWQENEAAPTQPLNSHQSLSSDWPAIPMACFEGLSPFVELNQSQLDTVTLNAWNSQLIRKTQLSGQFYNLNLQCGQRFDLQCEDPALKSLLQAFKVVGEMLVTSVRYHYEATRSSASGGRLYQQHHTFTALPLHVDYRPLFDPQEEIDTKPRFFGTMSAGRFYVSPQSKDKTAIPDDWGRIPVCFPFRYQVSCNRHHCRHIRVNSPMNHQTAGISAAHYADSEALIHFAEADLDRPMLVGTAANAKTGHIHSSDKQKRLGMIAPTGQYLMASAEQGDHNAVMMGCYHQQKRDHSFILMNNMNAAPDAKQPPLNFVMASTANYQLTVRRAYRLSFGSSVMPAKNHV